MHNAKEDGGGGGRSASLAPSSSSSYSSSFSSLSSSRPVRDDGCNNKLDALIRMGFSSSVASQAISLSGVEPFEKLVEVASGISLAAAGAVEAQSGDINGQTDRQKKHADSPESSLREGNKDHFTEVSTSNDNGAKKGNSNREGTQLAAGENDYTKEEMERKKDVEVAAERPPSGLDKFTSLLRRTAIVKIDSGDMDWSWHKGSRAGAARRTLFHLVDIHIKSVQTSVAQKGKCQQRWPSWKRRRLGHALCRQPAAFRAQGTLNYAPLPLLIRICVTLLEKSITDGARLGNLVDSLPKTPIRVDTVIQTKDDYDLHGTRVHALLLALQLLLLLFDDSSDDLSEQCFGIGEKAERERSAVRKMLLDLCSDKRSSLPLVVRWLAAEAMLSGIASNSLLLQHRDKQSFFVRALRSRAVVAMEGACQKPPSLDSLAFEQNAHHEWSSLAFLGSVSQLFEGGKGASEGAHHEGQRRTKRFANSLFVLPSSARVPAADYDDMLEATLDERKQHSLRQALDGLDPCEVVHGVNYITIFEGFLHEANEATLDAFHKIQTGTTFHRKASTVSDSRKEQQFAEKCKRLVCPFWKRLLELVAQVFQTYPGSKFHPTSVDGEDAANETEPALPTANTLLQATQQACAIVFVVTSRNEVARVLGRELLPHLFSLLAPLSNACIAYNRRAFPRLNATKSVTPTYFQDILVLCAHLGNQLAVGRELQADEIALLPLLSSTLFNGGIQDSCHLQSQSRVRDWRGLLMSKLHQSDNVQAKPHRSRQQLGDKGRAILALVQKAKKQFFANIHEAVRLASEDIANSQGNREGTKEDLRARIFGESLLTWIDSICGKSRQSLKRARRTQAVELCLLQVLLHHCENGTWIALWHATCPRQIEYTETSKAYAGPILREIAAQIVKTRFWFRELRRKEKANKDKQALVMTSTTTAEALKEMHFLSEEDRPLDFSDSVEGRHDTLSEEQFNDDALKANANDGVEEQFHRVRDERNRHLKGIQNAKRRRILDVVNSLGLDDLVQVNTKTSASLSVVAIERHFVRRCSWLLKLSSAAMSGSLKTRLSLWRLQKQQENSQGKRQRCVGIFLQKCKFDESKWEMSQHESAAGDLDLHEANGSDSDSDEDDKDDRDLHDVPAGKYLRELMAQIVTFSKGHNIFILERERKEAAATSLGILVSTSISALSLICKRRQKRAEERCCGFAVLEALCLFCKPKDSLDANDSAIGSDFLSGLVEDGTDWKHDTTNIRIRDGIEILGYIRGSLSPLYTWSGRANATVDGDWNVISASHHPLNSLRGCEKPWLDMVMESYWGLVRSTIAIFGEAVRPCSQYYPSKTTGPNIPVPVYS